MSQLDKRLREVFKTHIDSGHYTDEFDRLLEDVKTAFEEEGYLHLPSVKRGDFITVNGETVILNGDGTMTKVVRMTGQEFYDRFEKEWISQPIILNSGSTETPEDWIARIDQRVKDSVKKAAGLK